MCIVSFIGDDYKNTFPERWPNIKPYPNPGQQAIDPMQQYNFEPRVTKAEFDKLKAEVEELKKLLIAAKEFDSKTGQKDCEMEAKVDFIKKLAEFVGVDIAEIFKNEITSV